MSTLHQYDYIFAIGTIFAVLDAYCIGANDVANSWSTAVSARVFTLRQAVLAAALFEFLGAVLAGSRVTGTVKNGIVENTVFLDSAPLQLLAFTVALFCSSTWLLLATRMSWPVSTTYSIVSSIAGVGIAIGGFDAPNWGWNGASGLAAIWAGLGIAPMLAGAFAAVCFLMVKFMVLRTSNPLRNGFFAGPLLFFLVTAICTMSIIYKGAPNLNLDDLSQETVAAAIVITGVVCAALSVIFWIPYVRQKVVKKDYTIRPWHFFLGPLLWNREPPADAELVQKHVNDYRNNREEDYADSAQPTPRDPNSQADLEKDNETPKDPESSERSSENQNAPGAHEPHQQQQPAEHVTVKTDPQIEGPILHPRNLWIIVRYKILGILLHGTQVDIHRKQLGEKGSAEEARMRSILSHAKQYPNEVEHLFSFLQVITACVASFAHGSNDLANAIGPWSVIYHTWNTGTPSGEDTDVPVWQLVWGAAALVVGLATYGYNIIAVLGNKITLMSPSRGFTAELGAAITVILASQYAIPVSTTMCLTGGLLGVGICNGNFRAINWRQVIHIYIGWIATIVLVCIYSACTMAIVINAPRIPGATNA